MKRLVLPAGLLLVLFVRATVSATEQAQLPTDDKAAIEKSIRANAEAFVAAFAARDAAAIAAQWTADGLYINEDGQRFSGRAAIQAEYELLFANSPSELRMQMEIDSIRVLNPQTAIEEGRAALLPQVPGRPQVMSRYTAVHVKQGGQWLTAEVRDTRVELPPDAGSLSDLDWLVGSWSTTQGDTSVSLKFRWIENNHFLMRTTAVSEAGKPTVGGLEIVGVDPSTRQITSWIFNNDGSHAVGTWTPLDGSWSIATVGVMADGTNTSARYVLSRNPANELTWTSMERFLGDIVLPDLTEVKLTRDNK
jgi:uncharacterized protein (TIGR02246 family)